MVIVSSITARHPHSSLGGDHELVNRTKTRVRMRDGSPSVANVFFPRVCVDLCVRALIPPMPHFLPKTLGVCKEFLVTGETHDIQRHSTFLQQLYT